MKLPFAMKMIRCVAATVLLVSLTGCDALWGIDDSSDNDNAREPATAIVDPGLVVGLAAPDTVTVGEAFTVRFTVQNTTGETVDITTSSGCLALPSVVEFYGERVPFVGTSLGCTAAITTHTIPAGEALTQTFDLRASLSGSDSETAASPGPYTVQANFNWSIGGNEVSLSTLGRSFRVQP